MCCGSAGGCCCVFIELKYRESTRLVWLCSFVEAWAITKTGIICDWPKAQYVSGTQKLTRYIINVNKSSSVTLTALTLEFFPAKITPQALRLTSLCFRRLLFSNPQTLFIQLMNVFWWSGWQEPRSHRGRPQCALLGWTSVKLWEHVCRHTERTLSHVNAVSTY